MAQTDLAAGSVERAGPAFAGLPQAIAREPTLARPWTLRQTVVVSLIVLVFSAATAAIWPLLGAVVPWDSKNHFYPMFRFLAEGLAHGRMPLWNPYHFGGHPSVADPQSLVFTPTMVLFAWLRPGASMQTFDLVVFAHLVLGALAMVGLVRRRGWHPAAALLAALIFLLGGPASSRLQHTGMIISYSFLPLAVWMLEDMLARRSYRSSLLFGLAATLMALGRDQVAFLGCLTLAGCLAAAVAQAQSRFRYLTERLPQLALAGAIVAGCLAVPSLLTLQFLRDSNRPGIPFDVAAAGSLNPVNLVTLFAPNVFGSLNLTYDYWGPGTGPMLVADWTDRAIDYLFLGSLPALLLFWHGVGGGRLFGRGGRTFLLIAIAATLYALGRATPVFGLLFEHLPGVKLYRRPADATFLLAFALAFLSAYLLHRWIAEGSPYPFRSLPRHVAAALGLLAVGCAAILVGHAIDFPSGAQEIAGTLRQLALAVPVFAVLAAVLMAGGTGQRRRSLVAAGLVAATAAELVWRDAASALNAEPASRYVFAGMPPAQAAGLAALRRDMAAEGATPGMMPRVEILGLEGAWQNAAMVFHLQDTIGYNPLRIAEYEEAVGPGENAVDPTARQFPGTFPDYRCRLAALLGLDYLVLDRPLSELPPEIPRPRATQIYAAEGMHVYRLGGAAPRAYVATAVRSLRTRDVLASRVWPDAADGRTALVDAHDTAKLRQSYPGRTDAAPRPSSVRILAYADNRVVLDVDAGGPGLVVLHDLFYPGWQATVDGRRRPIVKADLLFRGVEVAAGHHLVVFEFHPFAPANLLAAARGLLPASRD